MQFRKALLRVVLACLLMTGLILTVASAAATDDFTFALNSAGTGYSITGYTGGAASVTVPDWYMGKPVTAIGAGAFQGNTVITSVELPSSITRIGAAAFKGCTSLSTLSSYAAGAAPARVAGDADDNGSVTMNDALLIFSYDGGAAVHINTVNADVNADGTVDAQDALLLLQRSAGWSVDLK